MYYRDRILKEQPYKTKRKVWIEFWHQDQEYELELEIDKREVVVDCDVPLLQYGEWWRSAEDPVFIRDIKVNKRWNPDNYNHKNHNRLSADQKERD